MCMSHGLKGWVNRLGMGSLGEKASTGMSFSLGAPLLLVKEGKEKSQPGPWLKMMGHDAEK